MSTDIRSSAANNPFQATNLPESSPRPGLKLVIPSIAVVLHWVIVEASFLLELPMFTRFITRVGALLGLFLFTLLWGITQRHFTFYQRLGVLITFIASFVGFGLLTDKTVGVFGTVMFAGPIAITTAVIWLWISSGMTARAKVIGVSLITVLVFAMMPLLRWDGLDGAQRSSYSWRWTPTEEQKFLQDSKKNAAAPVPVSIQTSPDDWNSFRGGDRQSVVKGVKLQDWKSSPPRELWRHRVGPAWSSCIVVGDFLFTQEQRDKSEAVVCYRLEDGKEVWAHSPNEEQHRFDEPLSGVGPRATPTFYENRLYTYGAKGMLECLDPATGKAFWSRNVVKETEAEVPMWGASTSPLVVDNLVVVFVGGKNDQGLMAYDRMTGAPVWHTAGGTFTFSSPQLFTIDGVRQIVNQDEKALYGVQVEDGKLLWKHSTEGSGAFQPMLQPHLIGKDNLIVGWNDGVLRLEVKRDGDKWATNQVWYSNRLKPGFNDFVIDGNYAYGFDDGILSCIELEKGERKWKAGRYGFGQLLHLPEQNELLITTEKGGIVRVAVDHEKLREIAKINAIKGKTWNHPIIAHGKLIVRNAEEMAAFELNQTAAK